MDWNNLLLVFMISVSQGRNIHRNSDSNQLSQVRSLQQEHHTGPDDIDAPFNIYRYDLHITPTIFNNNPSFYGNAAIQFSCHRSTNSIELHSKHLRIRHYYLYDSDAISDQYQATLWEYPENQRIQFDLDHNVLAGRNYTLDIDYEGKYGMDGHTRGVFNETYLPVGISETLREMFGTTLRPNHARSLFPCIDSPGHKSVFSVTVRIPSGMKVLTNTALKTSIKVGNSTYDVFRKTERLSPFHVALFIFHIGDWEIASHTYAQGISCDLWMPVQSAPRGHDLLTYIDRDVEFLTEYTGIQMLFPKMDFFAIPHYHTSAFEHPGLITMRNSIIKPSEEGIFHSPAKTVTHELTHQWFGNLVTPKSWGDLWISEGLTGFVTYKTLQNHHAHFEQFALSYHVNKQYIQYMDTFTNSLPVYQQFDEIPQYHNIYHPTTWTKGYALARVLEAVVGEDKFHHVLRKMLSGLWKWNSISVWEFLELLEEQSSDIKASLAWPWFTNTGYPVVTANKIDDTLELKVFHMTKMEYNGNMALKDLDYFHGILPIDYEVKYSDGSITNGRVTHQGANNTITVTLKSGHIEYVLINPDGLYYRVLYDDDLWLHLIDNLNTDSVVDHYYGRVSAMDDAFALSAVSLIDSKYFTQIMTETCQNEESTIDKDIVICSEIMHWHY